MQMKVTHLHQIVTEAEENDMLGPEIFSCVDHIRFDLEVLVSPGVWRIEFAIEIVAEVVDQVNAVFQVCRVCFDAVGGLGVSQGSISRLVRLNAVEGSESVNQQGKEGDSANYALSIRRQNQHGSVVEGNSDRAIGQSVAHAILGAVVKPGCNEVARMFRLVRRICWSA